MAAALTLASNLALAQGAGKLAILPVQGNDVPKAKIEVLSDALAGAFTDLLAINVLGAAEGREMLTPPQQKIAQACDNLACFSRLGKELQATLVVSVKATAANGKVLLSFKVADVEKQEIIARHQEPIGDDILTYADDCRAVVGQLRNKLPEALRAGPAIAAKAEPKKAEPAKVEAKPEPKPEAKPEPKSEAKPAEAKAAPVKPGWMGMSYQPMDAEASKSAGLEKGKGVLVSRVAPAGPAAAAGVSVGNVVLKVDGQFVAAPADVLGVVSKKGAGSTVDLTLWVSGQEKSVTVTLKDAPAKSDKK